MNFATSDWTPYDLTDYDLVFTMKYYGSDTEALLEKDLLKTDAAGWQVQLTIDATDWEWINAWSYYYDVQMSDSDWVVITVALGTYLLIQDVTN